MEQEIRTFVLGILRRMNYPTDDVTDTTVFGPAGVDMESLALAELGVRVEDEFGVEFTEDEREELAGFSVGEFCGYVADRMRHTANSGA